MKEITEEFEGIDFKSERLEKRFIRTMETLSKQPDKSLWLASGSRSEAKAMYRLLSNEKVEREEILRVHRESTEERMKEYNVVLAVQDTTSVNYNNQRKMEGLGYIGDKTLGINVHSCLAVTPEGLVLGVLDQNYFTRAVSKDGSASHDQKKGRPIAEKESYRWLETMEHVDNQNPETKIIHICDREGDMYELFEKAAKTEKLFLIRVIQNRTTTEGGKMLDEIKNTPSCGEIRVMIPRDSRKNIPKRDALLEIRYKDLNVQKPKRQNKYKTLSPSVTMNMISVKEVQHDTKSEPIEWILATNDEIDSFDDAYEKVCNYIQRWKIERFHYVLKSGCQIEKLQESSVEKTALLILMYSVIAARIMNITYLSRIAPDEPCDIFFDTDEWQVLYCAAKKTKNPPGEPYSIREAVEYIALLGGFKGAKSDGAPGLKVIWIGLNKLYVLLAYREFI